MRAVSFVAYNLEELRAPAELWHAAVVRQLESRGLAAEVRADWSADHQSLCSAPDLLLGQTCGYPLRNALKGQLRVVAAPRYDAPGCEGPRYASLIVVRADDTARTLASLHGRTCAFNSCDSHSGYNALRYHVAPLARAGSFFAHTVETGAHVESIAAVARGEADVAAIDGVVWGLLERHRPHALAGVRVLMHTERAPALPYVTPAGTGTRELELIREALWAAAGDPALVAARAALLLRGFEVLGDTAYEQIDRIERTAMLSQYPALR